jgi:vitamin B12 transport system permease protein
MTVRQIVGECFALCCAVMLGLAAGAVWLLPTVYLHRPLPWLAIPAGWLLGIAMRQWVHGKKWNAALLAALATAIASIYIRVLITTVNISAMTDYGLLDAARTAGFSMLWDFTRFTVSRMDIVWSLAGIVVAAVMAMRTPATRRNHRRLG